MNYTRYDENNIRSMFAYLIICIMSFLISFVFYNSKAISIIVMGITFPFAKKYYEKTLIKRKKRILQLQFHELLSAIQIGLESGGNFHQSLVIAKNAVAISHERINYIDYEVEMILLKHKNGISLEDALHDFAIRSDIESIKDFSRLYSIASRRSNNLESIVKQSIDLISEMVALDQEVQTVILEKKIELYIMSVLPVLLMAFFRMFSPMYYQILFSNILGIIVVTISLALFIAAQYLARKIIGAICDL